MGEGWVCETQLEGGEKDVMGQKGTVLGLFLPAPGPNFLLATWLCLGRKPQRAPQLEETPETPPSSRAEGLLFLHSLESNPGSSLQTEEEAGLP